MHEPRWPILTLALTIALAVAGVSGRLAAQVAAGAQEAAGYTVLHAAAQRGDTAQIGQLAAAGAALNALDDRGHTPLHVATLAKQREAIRALARAGAHLNALDNDRLDVVTMAAANGDEETLRLLLSLGASAKQVTGPDEGTALMAAARKGSVGAVRQLIAAGAPLDHVNNLHWTAAIQAVILGDGGPAHQAVLRALVEAGADLKLTDRNGSTPLQLARARDYTEMVRMLERVAAR
jgi:hypothetical protein